MSVWRLFGRRNLIVPVRNLLKQLAGRGAAWLTVGQFALACYKLTCRFSTSCFSSFLYFHDRCACVKRASGCSLCPTWVSKQHRHHISLLCCVVYSTLFSNPSWSTKTATLLSLSVALWPTKRTSTTPVIQLFDWVSVLLAENLWTAANSFFR